MSDKLRKRIASERRERVLQISDLQTEVAQLEAELRVALEEDKQTAAQADERWPATSETSEGDVDSVHRALRNLSVGSSR